MRRSPRRCVAWSTWSSGTPAGRAAWRRPSADPAVTEVAAGSGLLVPGPVRPLPQLRARPAAFFGVPVVRRPGGGPGHRGRRRLHRQRADRQGPRPRSLGAARPAPDRARGRRRGADPADRSGARPAPGRRLGVVPARQVRRAGRAHQHGAPVAGRRDRRDGAVVPRARAWPGESARHRAGPARERPADAGDGRLLCIDGPAGSGKTTLAALASDFDWLDSSTSVRESRLVHMDDLFEGWAGCRTVDEQLDGLLTPLGEGRPGSYRRYDWLAGGVRRDREGRAGAAPGARGRRQRRGAVRPTCARCWSGSRRRTTSACAVASSATATRSRRTGSSGRATSGPVRPRAHPVARGRRRRRHPALLRLGAQQVDGPALRDVGTPPARRRRSAPVGFSESTSRAARS